VWSRQWNDSCILLLPGENTWGGELGLGSCAFVVGDGGGGLGLEGGRNLVMGLADAECRVQLICCIQYELSLV